MLKQKGLTGFESVCVSAPVHDDHIIEEGVSLGAEPTNIGCTAPHDHQPQPHTCTPQASMPSLAQLTPGGQTPSLMQNMGSHH